MKKLLLIVSIVLFISCKNEINSTTKLENIPAKTLLDNSNNLFSNQLPNSEFSKFYLKKNPDDYLKSLNITINTNADDSMTFEGAEVLPEKLVNEVTDFIDFASEGRNTTIHINFDKQSTFGHYKNIIPKIKKLKKENVTINHNLFIYDKAKLPDCDCTL